MKETMIIQDRIKYMFLVMMVLAILICLFFILPPVLEVNPIATAEAVGDSATLSLLDALYNRNLSSVDKKIEQLKGEWILDTFEITVPIEYPEDFEIIDSSLKNQMLIIHDDFTVVFQSETFIPGRLILGGIIEIELYTVDGKWTPYGIFIAGPDRIFFWAEQWMEELKEYKYWGMYEMKKAGENGRSST